MVFFKTKTGKIVKFNVKRKARSIPIKKTVVRSYTMARKRSKGRFRSRVSRFARRSNRSVGVTPMNLVLAGAIYGYARPIAANMLPNMFSFGPVDSDNILIGAASYYGMRKSSGIVKALSTVALAGEASIIAQRLGSGTSVSTTNASNQAWF
jgi:hypothetical protein